MPVTKISSDEIIARNNGDVAKDMFLFLSRHGEKSLDDIIAIASEIENHAMEIIETEKKLGEKRQFSKSKREGKSNEKHNE